MTPTPTCRVCRNTVENRLVRAREMMFGWRDEFDYVECGACGCVQIADVPADLQRYYPAEYVAYREVDGRPPSVRDRLLASRTAYQLGDRSLLGWMLNRLRPSVPPYVEWSRRAGVRQGDHILDAGCGHGALLLQMRQAGYTRLLGVDPFIESAIDYANGVRIIRGELADLRGEFDLVMMHHAFEHVPDPAGTLREIARLLAPRGTALIRIPVADSHAWRTYGTNWVQLDPPRHLFLHTHKSMEILAAAARLRIRDVVHDSWGIQFWGSEQYLRDIPLRDPSSVDVDPARSMFTAEELRQFTAHAEALNATGEGDMAAFYLRKL